MARPWCDGVVEPCLVGSKACWKEVHVYRCELFEVWSSARAWESAAGVYNVVSFVKPALQFVYRRIFRKIELACDCKICGPSVGTEPD